MAKANANNGGVYANMDFEKIYGAYSYQEYPKQISTGPHGRHEIAKTPQDEERILNKLQKNEDDALPEPVMMVNDPEKDILISRAHELGVPINRKWSKLKIQQAIDEVEDEVNSLPPEKLDKEEDQVLLQEHGESPDDYKDRLITLAKSHGIPANRLWGVPRLKLSINEAESRQKQD